MSKNEFAQHVADIIAAFNWVYDEITAGRPVDINEVTNDVHKNAIESIDAIENWTVSESDRLKEATSAK